MADTLTSPMHVEIMSPDGAVYTADGVEMVVARAIDGEFAVMKGHLPLVAALTIAPVRVKKDGKEKTYYIYNVCDHQECYKEVGSQAISYTTGVPAMCGALMLLTGKWNTKGVHTVEEFDPDPYLDALDKYGLPRSESHDPALVD